MTTEAIRHHPSGRPGVAQDGTLYAATDGAVVALDSKGEEIGRALYDAGVGEVVNGSNDLGTIRPNAFADILLWDGNPLEDIDLILDESKLSLIMKDGVVYKDIR